MAETRGRRIVRGLMDNGPGLAFIAVYLITRDFRLATEVLVGAALATLAAMLALERRFRVLPTTVAALAVVFGGASLLLRDPVILKMKMSIVDGLLGSILLGGVALKRNPLRMVLGASFALTEKAWAILAVRYGLFWWVCAVANEAVRRTQSDHVWVLFRAGALAAAVIFALAQVPFLLKHNALATSAEPAPPADLGV